MPVQVLIRNLKGQTVVLEVPDTEITVREFKERIRQRLGGQDLDFGLVFGGAYLDDDNRLIADYNIQKHTVTMVVPLPGGF
jgi:hypothetical protein